MFLKYTIGLFLILNLYTQAKAENCSTRTGSNATVILPAEVASSLQTGDVVKAYYGSTCIGKALYRRGEAVALAIWGDDSMTSVVDGSPENHPFALVVVRSSNGSSKLAMKATFVEGKKSVYEQDGIYIADNIDVEGSSGNLDGRALAVSAVAASSNDGNRPSGAIDGDLATRWSAKGKRQWLRLDLGQKQQLGAIEIAWYRGTKRKTFFDLETSADGKRWQRKMSGISSGRTSGLERYAFAAETRFVRIVGHGNSDNAWNSISEVKLYGREAIHMSKASLAESSSETAEDLLAGAGQTTPTAYALEANYPNPFNPATTIGYSLPRATKVMLTIYNVAGQRVRQLVSQHQQAGKYRVRWDGRDASGRLVGSGMYAYQISAEDFRQTRTMVLVK